MCLGVSDNGKTNPYLERKENFKFLPILGKLLFGVQGLGITRRWGGKKEQLQSRGSIVAKNVPNSLDSSKDKYLNLIFERFVMKQWDARSKGMF